MTTQLITCENWRDIEKNDNKNKNFKSDSTSLLCFILQTTTWVELWENIMWMNEMKCYENCEYNKNCNYFTFFFSLNKYKNFNRIFPFLYRFGFQTHRFLFFLFFVVVLLCIVSNFSLTTTHTCHVLDAELKANRKKNYQLLFANLSILLVSATLLVLSPMLEMCDCKQQFWE